jgi:uroporphyrinogen-III synthase
MVNKVLYLGLDLPNELQQKEVTHCPLIRIVPRPCEDSEIAHAFANLKKYTHLIFTSKSAVRIFFEYSIIYGISLENLKEKIFLSVGQKTTQQLKKNGINRVMTANDERAEGMIALLASLNLANAFIFWPHSALSRFILLDWLKAKQHNQVMADFKFDYTTCIFYDTVLNTLESLPKLSEYDEIIFTSPSTVDAFWSLFGKPPIDKTLTCIGPVTQKYLEEALSNPIASMRL